MDEGPKLMPAQKKKPALFLDRDGTINIDRVYINDPRLIELIPGAAEAIRDAKNAGFVIVVITNQSGVGRGIIDIHVLPTINKRLDRLLLARSGVAVDLYKMCVHAPQENCNCRKPKPTLVLEAAKELNLDLKNSFFIGDRLTDIATGKAAACKANILVRTGKGDNEGRLYQLGSKKNRNPKEEPDYVAEDLRAAVDWILASSKNLSSKV